MMNGIIYIADGEGFAGQCRHGIEIMRKRCSIHPPIHVFTSNPEMFEDMAEHYNVEASLIESQPANLWKTPFKRTLFLDTDTIVLNDHAFEPFKILDRFNFALCHAPTRGFNVMRRIPNCVPSWNSGVVFFNDGKHAKDAVLRYRNQFERASTAPRTSDQAFLSRVIYNHPAKVFTLPPEYNCRGKESGVPTPSMLRIIHHHKAFKLLKRGLTVDEVARRFATHAKGI